GTRTRSPAARPAAPTRSARPPPPERVHAAAILNGGRGQRPGGGGVAAPQPVKVLVVEDEGLFRDMLQTALAAQPAIQVVGAVATGEEAVREAERVAPDVVLADIELGPGLNGVEAASRIRARHPETGVVLLSAHRDKQYIASLPAGEARGWSYLLKSSVT